MVPHLVDQPRQQDAICDHGGVDVHQIEKALEDAEALRAAPFEADAASAGKAGQGRVRETGIPACGSHPDIEVLVGGVSLLDADTGAVGAAQI